MSPAADIIRAQLAGLEPKTAVILGSGLGTLVDGIENAKRIAFADLPGFPAGSVSGHAGEVVTGTLSGRPVIMLSGRVHYYEKGDASVMRLPIATLRELGVDNLILTNSAGSLREELAPGSVMRITDHINYSGYNPLIGEESDKRFVGMTQAYDKDLADRMERAAEKLGIPLASGVYMWFSGPSFETPAEIRMARILGADAVGMSTVPEAILGRFFDMKVTAASVVTNYGAGMTGGELSHAETKEMAPIGGGRLASILTTMIADGL